MQYLNNFYNFFHFLQPTKDKRDNITEPSEKGQRSNKGQTPTQATRKKRDFLTLQNAKKLNEKPSEFHQSN